MARDLKGAGGRGLVIAGDTQPKEVHALAHLINHALGNVGKTVEYLPRIDEGPADQVGSLRELAGDIDAGAVDTLIILGGNPAYDAPADLDFAQAALRRQDQACGSTWACTTTRPRSSATGTSPRPTAWRPGAISGPSTARRRSSSP